MAQIENKIKLVLKPIAEEQGFKQYNISVKAISSGGANYSSTLYLAEIQDNDNVLNLFIKVIALSKKMQEQFGANNVFSIEKLIYTKLKKAFYDLEEEHNVPEKDRFVLPVYFELNTTEELLVFEDLTARGFSCYDRLKSIDWPYASASVTQLARFHALGMALEHQKPKEYAEIVEGLHFDFLSFEGFDVVWKNGFNMTVKVANKEYKEKLVKLFDELYKRGVREIFQPVIKAGLAHLDYRVSNLMHRYKDDGTIELIPVDYQTIRWMVGCQIIDLLYFIFSGSDQEFRKQYFTKLVDLYYEQLSAALTKLGQDPETTYSRADFDTEFKKKLPCGLSLAAFILPFLTVETENAPKVDGSMELESLVGYKTSELFVERINGVIEDMVAWGVLE